MFPLRKPQDSGSSGDSAHLGPVDWIVFFGLVAAMCAGFLLMAEAKGVRAKLMWAGVAVASAAGWMAVLVLNG